MGVTIKVIKPEYRYSPLIEFGVPNFKEGSADHEEFWEEQRHRCLEGFKPPGGHWINPAYYFHLNFEKLSRIAYSFDIGAKGNKIVANPLFRDVEDEVIFKQLWEMWLDKNGGGIVGKKRRQGVSDGFISFGHWVATMFPNNSVFMGTPHTAALEIIKDKFKIAHRSMPVEFYQNLLIDNKDQTKFGATLVLPEGNKEVGTLSNIFWRVFTRAGVFKGAWASFALIDEIGEFTDNPSLLDCYSETIDCMKEGAKWIGLPILAGTTDTKNMKNISFMQMWNNAESFDLRKIFIPADYTYDDKYFDFSTGKSDRVGALKEINAKIEKLNKLSDKTAVLKFRQNNPRTEDDMFLVIGSSRINTARVNECIKNIQGNVENKFFGQWGRFIWVKNKANGGYRWSVEWVKCDDPDMVRWYKTFEPINENYPNADIMGIDDYYKDIANYSESKGAIVVFRRRTPGQVSRIPVITYWNRPTLTEFHDDCLKTAVYYQCESAIEYHNDMLKKYYLENEKVDGKKYLRNFPRVNGKVVNPADSYGFLVGTAEKEIIVPRAAEWVNSPDIENCRDAFFLRELVNIGTDRNTDLGDAFGICLLDESDRNIQPVRSLDQVREDGVRIDPLYVMGSNGIPVLSRNAGRMSKEQRAKQHKVGWMQTLNQ